ncbi:Cd2+/Zn2+-exporting ATPase [Enterococcus sp. PF1-24]|uniref:heavy metal translocating P-type ATPase n=1 Tax=unclassified Enterococcus TaxID=2608891 RepID=UPI002476E7C7|nr:MULTISPECIES: heavy metal translocating P-type ATPase [unclassified Enterococcus]MDH6364028.1 Cd2+/Zn2+-exporting ATPase [Enterococcus sp. PFB1-1]MDH6401129.1 Cd2+/Zn2+-exporting ATPase [Enterococcus sp. PF1-24]
MNKEVKQALLSTISCLLFMIIGFTLEKNNLAIAPLFFTIAIIAGGWKQTYEGLQELFTERHLNVDLLMALAAIGACLIGNWLEGAMLTFIFCLSGALEEYATNKSQKEITSLMKMQPATALVLANDGTTIETNVKDLQLGQKVLVPKGAAIAIDGQLIQGSSTIDEAALSGESIPVEKQLGDLVYAGTTNLGHAITIEVTQKSEDTLFSKIIQLVEEAQNTPTKTASFIEKIENVYVKIVLITVPIMIVLPHFLLGWEWSESFYRGMVLLVVASPCALVAAATPATLAAISNGARNGVLFKGGIYLENLAQLKAIAFDKTGTLTQGSPVVTDSIFLGNQEESIQAMLAMESKTTHPLAEALLTHFLVPIKEEFQQIEVEEVTGFGLQSMINGHLWKIGKYSFNEAEEKLADDLLDKVNYLQSNGRTVIYLLKDNQLQAIFALFDVARPEAKQVISYFNSQGIHTTMITGDNQQTAKVVAEEVGVNDFYGGCLPADKTELITEEHATYQVNVMVGDGVNDAPALATASIGVAMGEGTAVAMDVADVVLIKNDLTKLQMSHMLSLKLQKIIKQNIIFSVSVIILLILANFFQVISLPLGVVGHEGSTILVILNGLRLLRTIPLKNNQDSTNGC